MFNDKANRTNQRYARYSSYTPVAGAPKREPIHWGWWLFAGAFALYFGAQFLR